MPEGYLYILKNPSMPQDCLKIGRTHNMPEMRARELSRATGVAMDFQVAYQVAVADCIEGELRVHQRLASRRINDKREFFCVQVEEAKAVLNSVAEELRNQSKICHACEIRRQLNSLQGRCSSLERACRIAELAKQEAEKKMQQQKVAYNGSRQSIDARHQQVLRQIKETAERQLRAKNLKLKRSRRRLQQLMIIISRERRYTAFHLVRKAAIFVAELIKVPVLRINALLSYSVSNRAERVASVMVLSLFFIFGTWIVGLIFFRRAIVGLALILMSLAAILFMTDPDRPRE